MSAREALWLGLIERAATKRALSARQKAKRAAHPKARDGTHEFFAAVPGGWRVQLSEFDTEVARRLAVSRRAGRTGKVKAIRRAYRAELKRGVA